MVREALPRSSRGGHGIRARRGGVGCALNIFGSMCICRTLLHVTFVESFSGEFGRKRDFAPGVHRRCGAEHVLLASGRHFSCGLDMCAGPRGVEGMYRVSALLPGVCEVRTTQGRCGRATIFARLSGFTQAFFGHNNINHCSLFPSACHRGVPSGTSPVCARWTTADLLAIPRSCEWSRRWSS